MKIYIHPVTKGEITVTDPNHYSIYERYEYREKKKEVKAKSTTKK